MCGIAGFTGKKNSAVLKKMTDVIRYRGPDAEGFFENGRINFGHRRLSIIDLSSGDQPMFTQDRKTAVIFNGEIYNYSELKRDELSGRQFVTTSDTEVLLHMYRLKGEAFAEYLNGMFAIALWDDSEEKLVLARDRMGKKPLYYMIHDGELYFASEPKALVHILKKPELNMRQLMMYLNFQYVLGGESIYEGIHRLLPGHYLVWQRGTARIETYWRMAFRQVASYAPATLDALLSDAVEKRLMADVPLGVFLSGGIDSSTITYYAKRASKHKLKTFSIGFSEESFDESFYSNLVARHLGTEHYHKIFSPKEMLACLPRVFALMDEPLADASILPTYLLSQFAREHVMVALGGDGADELFAGYPTFIAHRLLSIYEHLPRFVDGSVARLARMLPVSHSNISFDFKIKQALKGVRLKSYRRDIAWMGAFSFDEQMELLAPAMHASGLRTLAEETMSEYFSMPIDSEDNEILHFWQKGYLIEDILVKVDRAAMYNSLEVRAPFLDYRVVDYVDSIPFREKYRGFTTKFALKQLMKDRLPSQVVWRPKKGFGIPLSRWLNYELADYANEMFDPRRIQNAGIFDEQIVRRLLDEHRSKKFDHRLKLWTLIVFMQWHKQWI